LTRWQALDRSDVGVQHIGEATRPVSSGTRIERMLIKRRTFFALVGPLPLLLVANGGPLWFLAGAVISLAGALIRVWAAGCIMKNEKLCESGPFALVRNPLYLGSLLVLVGYCIMSGRWWTPLVWLPLFAAFYVPTIVAEERNLSKLFGKDYDRYRQNVPPLFPRPCRRADIQGTPFSLRHSLVKNREYQGLLGTLAMIGLFAVVNFCLR